MTQQGRQRGAPTFQFFIVVNIQADIDGCIGAMFEFFVIIKTSDDINDCSGATLAPMETTFLAPMDKKPIVFG